jgi:hypothetical protein
MSDWARSVLLHRCHRIPSTLSCKYETCRWIESTDCVETDRFSTFSIYIEFRAEDGGLTSEGTTGESTMRVAVIDVDVWLYDDRFERSCF